MTLKASGSDTGERVKVLLRLADALLHDERLVDAEANAAMARSEAIDASSRKQALVLLARIAILRGDIAQSEAAAAEAKELPDRQQASTVNAWLIWLSAHAHWPANQTESALLEFQHAIQTAQEAEGDASNSAAEMRLWLGYEFVENNRPQEGLQQILPTQDHGGFRFAGDDSGRRHASVDLAANERDATNLP